MASAEYPAKESSPIEIAAVLVLLRDCVNGHYLPPSFPSLLSFSLSLLQLFPSRHKDLDARPARESPGT